MIKLAAAIRRAEGVSREEFFDAWRNVHAPHVAKLAKPLAYRLTFFDSAADGAELSHDGMAEIWFRDQEHYDNGLGKNASPELPNDGFGAKVDPQSAIMLMTDEHVIVDAETTETNQKFTAFLKRKDGVDRGAYFDHWLSKHAPNVAGGIKQTDGALRYTIATSLADGSPYDGVAGIHWRDDAARLAGLQGVVDDGFGEVNDASKMIAFLGREIVIV